MYKRHSINADTAYNSTRTFHFTSLLLDSASYSLIHIKSMRWCNFFIFVPLNYLFLLKYIILNIYNLRFLLRFVFIVWWRCEGGTGGVGRDKKTHFVTFRCVVCRFFVLVSIHHGDVRLCGSPGDMTGQRLQWPKSWTALNFRLKFLIWSPNGSKMKKKMCCSFLLTATGDSF